MTGINTCVNYYRSHSSSINIIMLMELILNNLFILINYYSSPCLYSIYYPSSILHMVFHLRIVFNPIYILLSAQNLDLLGVTSSIKSIYKFEHTDYFYSDSFGSCQVLFIQMWPILNNKIDFRITIITVHFPDYIWMHNALIS